MTENPAAIRRPSMSVADSAAMDASVIDRVPLFELRDSIPVAASPDDVYTIVSALERTGEWSPECRGGEWVSGEPGALGSVFRGHNFRPDDVVGWAPLIRGDWDTYAQVVAAEPGRSFAWAMRTHAGQNQESVWGFDIEPGGTGSDGSGCVLVHHFRMGHATEGIHHITDGLDEAARAKFVDEWTAKLAEDMRLTLSRIKAIAER